MEPSDNSEIPNWSPYTTSTPFKENPEDISSDSIVAWTPKCTRDSPQSLDMTISSVLSQWNTHGRSDASLSVVEWTPDCGKEPSFADSIVSWSESHDEQHGVTPASNPMKTPSTTNLVSMKPKQIFSNMDIKSQSSSDGELLLN